MKRQYQMGISKNIIYKNINARLPKRSGGQAEDAKNSQKPRRIIGFFRDVQILIVLFFLLSAIFVSCSDLKNDLPTATSAVSKIHEEGWSEVSSVGFHGKAIQSDNWDIRPCKKCHGLDYKGGSSGKTCLGCHNQPGGPENCGTCHGNNIAAGPPPDLSGNTSNSARGVGFHQVHLNGTGNVSSVRMVCTDCHHYPEGSIYDPQHIDGSEHAEVLITGPLATLKTGGTALLPTYDATALTCKSIYCHGAWILNKSGLPSDSVFSGTTMMGLNQSPVWNGGSAQTQSCASCHAMPPHKDYSLACSVCHEDVTSASGKLKHINGKIDLSGGVVRDFR